MADPEVLKEIEGAISRALARAGHGGTVIVRDDHCELHTDGPVIAIDLGDWVGQWNLLPDDIKEQRAEKAAARLTSAQSIAPGRSVPVPKAVLQERLRRTLVILGVVVGFALIGTWLYRNGFFGEAGETAETAPSPSASTSAPAYEGAAARRERERKVCDAARQRMVQGGSLGLDIAGWVVELWLARDSEGIARDEALMARVESGVEAEIGAKSRGTLSLHEGGTELGLSAVVVRFSDGYVPPFFTAKGRERFVDVAERFADDVGAVHAGLFARCAHRPNDRDVGAWYRGVDDNGALVSLLFAAGHFANPPAFDAKAYEGEGLLTKLRRSVAGFDKSQRDEILRRQGGRPHEHAADGGKKAVSLRFPLGGPTRAVNATRDIAKKLDL